MLFRLSRTAHKGISCAVALQECARRGLGTLAVYQRRKWALRGDWGKTMISAAMETEERAKPQACLIHNSMKRTVRHSSCFLNHTNASTLQQDHSAEIPKLIEILVLPKAQVESSLKCAVTLTNPVGTLSYHITTALQVAGISPMLHWYWFGILRGPQ